MMSNFPPGFWLCIHSATIANYPLNGTPLRCNQWHLLPLDQRGAADQAVTNGRVAYSQYSVEIWPE